MKHKSSQFPSSVTITRTLLSVFGLTLTQEVKAYRSLIEREVKHRGWRTTCAYLKDLYTQSVAMSLGLPPDPIPFRKSDRKGFSRDLRHFKKLLKSDLPDHKRAAHTILRQCYLIHSDAVMDISSITSTTEREGVNAIVKPFTRFATRWLPTTDLKGKIEVVPRAKAGPNGPSSLLSSHLDSIALSQRPELLQALQDLADCIDTEGRGEPDSGTKTSKTWMPDACPDITCLPGFGPENKEIWTRGLKPWVLRLAAWTKSQFPLLDTKQLLPVSRLALLTEGGCKTRVIAIGDLFSQAVLRPIHRSLMDKLRKLDQDCTFDQTKAIDFLKKKTLAGPVYSFDLTNATDRFPLQLQEIVVSRLFGPEIGKLWSRVMSHLRDFTLRKGDTKIDSIYYKQGQAMGLYSSWPAFAYTHHILIQLCARRVRENPKVTPRKGALGKLPFTDYRVIGDDVTIANTKVAAEYRKILALLEIPISEKKSIVSEHPPYSGEIAKRLIHHGVDVSPIPPELIKQSSRHVTMLPALIDEIGNRYGLSYSTLSTLPALAANFSRSRLKEQANILLTAPLAFALWGQHSFYGANLNRGNAEQETSARAILKLSPWVRVDPEVIPDTRLIQEQVRKVFLLRQYEEAFKSWNYVNPELDDAYVPTVKGPRDGLDKTQVTIGTQHPFWAAYAWVSCELNYLFQLRMSSIERGDDDTIGDIGLQFCLDPTLRVYRDKKAQASQTSSHLTLEVFKILTGEKPFPEVQHPKDGIRTAVVKLKAH